MLKVCTGLGSLKVWSCERNVTFTFWPFYYLHQTINLGSNSSTPCSWRTAGWGALFVRNRWLADTHTHTDRHTADISFTLRAKRNVSVAPCVWRGVAPVWVGDIAICAAWGRYKALSKIVTAAA
jgi:hypothetical protein